MTLPDTRKPLRIGIDVHLCRTSQTGIYTFIWNTIERLQRLPNAPQLTMILYGPANHREPVSIARMQAKFGLPHFAHYWTRVSPWLFVRRRHGMAHAPAKWRVALDRLIMLRLWRKLTVTSSGPLTYVVRPFQQHRPPRWWEQLDIVHHTAGVLLPLHRNANVLTINDLIPHHFQHQYRPALRWFGESFAMAGQMDAILVYSEHTKRDIVATLGVDPARVHVVPLAAHRHFRYIEDRSAVHKVLAKYDLQEQGYILYVGSLEPRKNVERLVEAFNELRLEEPTLQQKLIFAGPKKVDTYDSIFRVVGNLGLEAQVLWIGELPFDDLPALMNGASVFVYPSLYEGFGLPPLEAMACGTPVIASHATSIPEVVGDAGILFDPYRVKEMTGAMKRVLTEPGLQARMRTSSLKRAASFSWDRTAKRTFAVYEDAIEQASLRGRPNPDIHRRSITQKLVDAWLFDRLSEQVAEAASARNE